MAEARAEVNAAAKTRTESIGTIIGRDERERRERQRAHEAAKPPEVKAKENSEKRAAFLAESTARILSMADRGDLAEGVTADEMIPRVKLIEAREQAAAKSYGPGTPEREALVTEATERVLGMAGAKGLTETDDKPPATPSGRARAAAKKGEDFIAESTARILRGAGVKD